MFFISSGFQTVDIISGFGMIYGHISDNRAYPTACFSNNNNNNIRLIRRCQNATCYNNMDRTVKKHEVTEQLDC